MIETALPILLVDDEKQILYSYGLMLRRAGIPDILTVEDSRKVMPLLAEQDIAMAVVDLVMPHISGKTLLSRIKSEYPHIPVIVITALNELEKAVECMKAGASDYLVKPVEKSRFVSSIQRVLEMKDLRNELSSLKEHFLKGEPENKAAFSSIISRNHRMKAIFNYIEAIAPYQRPVLLSGETGVGKELIAFSIHQVSGLRGEFVAINVAGLDDTVFSDTLFGHEKGAYTGADRKRDGLIVRASGGTMLLDEMGDLNESSQVKLLRLLEENTYYPLGSDRPVKSTARIIVSTNQDIQKKMQEGRFRKDLYYRLCTHQIHIPPLRERPDDIPLLVDHFLEDAAKAQNKRKPAPPKELLVLLSNYHYPGNIRELKAMVFDAVAQHRSGILSTESFKEFIKLMGSLPLSGKSLPLQKPASMLDIFGHFPTLKETEEYLIADALKRSDGNQGIAASLLGIKRQALNRRLNKK